MSKRNAVSVLVTGKRDEREVLLVERNPKLKFFGGFFAFPGGKVDPSDAELPVEHAESRGDVPPAMWVAAARELFEETGLWVGLGRNAPSPDALVRARRALLSEEIDFSRLLSELGQSVDASLFEPLGRMTTPPFSPLRYDTWFFHCRTDQLSSVEIWPGELVTSRIVDPERAGESWKRGEFHLAPPMIVLLQEWERGSEAARIAISALCQRYIDGELHRIYFSPGILLVPLTTPTRPPATHTNTLVVGEEKLFLVDPSPIDVGEQQRLFDMVDRLIAEGRRLEAILLTHYHPDHVGAVVPAAARYSIPVLAHQKTAEALRDIRVDQTLSHGQTLDLGSSPDGRDGWNLTVYHVPGHAPGHLAFKENRYGALIVGDLVSTLSSILIDTKDGHLATYLRSLASLEPLADGAIYPGHGPPSIRGKEVIRGQLEHRAARETQLLSALSHEARPIDALVAQVYVDVPENLHPLAKRSLMSGLVKLKEEGRIEETGEGYRLV